MMRLGLAVLGVMAVSSVAQARPRPPLRLSADVVSVTTEVRDGARLRAIVAEERGATVLQVERMAETRRGWVTDDVARYDDFMIGDRLLDTRFARIENVSFRRRVIAFDLVAGDRYACRVRLENMRGTTVARCESRWDDDEAWERPQPRPDWDRPGRPDHDHDHDRPDPRPEPRPVNWAAQPQVIRACGDAFIGSNSQVCLDVVNTFVQDPVPAIQACEQHVVGDTSGLACLRTVAPMWGNVAAVIDACDDAMVGDSSTLQCIEATRGARGDAAPTVRACGESNVGDSAALQCVRRAFGSNNPY